MFGDHLYAGIAVALTAAALSLFGARLLLRGAVRFDRVDAAGGSVLLSKRFVEMGYWAILPVARACARVGVTPNHISWAALALGLGSGVAAAFGLLGLAGLLALLSALGDIVDGQVARLTGTGSAAGELLDASVDRYMEFAFLAGAAIFYRGHAVTMLVPLGALLAAFMISYSTAKAEALQVEPPKGLMRRHERATYLIAGSVLSSVFSAWLEPFGPLPALHAPLFFGALAVIAVAGNVSAVRRLAAIGRALRAREARP